MTIPTLLMPSRAIRCQTRPQCQFLTTISTTRPKVFVASVGDIVRWHLCHDALVNLCGKSTSVAILVPNPNVSPKVFPKVYDDGLFPDILRLKTFQKYQSEYFPILTLNLLRLKKIPSLVTMFEYVDVHHLPILSPVSSREMCRLYPETNTVDNSLPEVGNQLLNLEEPSSGSPTTPSDLSLPDYKAFYIDNDHFKEKISSSNRSKFIRSSPMNSAHILSQQSIISIFKDEPELGNFTMDVVGNIFQTKEPRVHVLNVLPTLELDFIPSSESIFAYVVWIFLPFLFIPVIPPYLLSCGDEDTIFDPGISKKSFF
ncbi:hypothetical protein Tco_0525153 [Tanacetum coccineum]